MGAKGDSGANAAIVVMYGGLSPALASRQRLLDLLVVGVELDVAVREHLVRLDHLARILQRLPELRFDRPPLLLVLPVACPHRHAILLPAEAADRAANLLRLRVVLADQRQRCPQPHVVDGAAREPLLALLVVRAPAPRRVVPVLPHGHDALAEEMVVAAHWELARRRHVVHHPPELLDRCEVADPLHVLRPVVCLGAAAGRQRAIEPEHPLRVQQERPGSCGLHHLALLRHGARV
eukprot:CAMPEP_0180212940 /NCGR_PEP_ID=MMETSP0987-20121128/13829_1 /TAXON_ID=697907 /ORGANISM="non described non described, Strain CCMP2293" /LENGTH=235 /DNA_ID=CAMNT_0022170763 /DNA_START=138 /DNA_END=843 /DNA_ORIENTATION=-